MDGCKQWIRIKDNHIHRIHSMLGDLNANIPMLTVHRHNAMNLNRPTSVRELEWPELAERKRKRFKQKTSIVYRILSSWIESIHELVDFVVEHGAFSFFQLVFSLIFLFLASAFSALNSPFRAPHLSLARTLFAKMLLFQWANITHKLKNSSSTFASCFTKLLKSNG